jgi:LEA14-like dessication related protein
MAAWAVPRRALVALAAVALAGCAALPRPVPPEVVGANVRVVELRLPAVRLAVEIALRNPNAFGLAVDALDATLAVGGADIGRAILQQPVTLPALGEARVPLDLRGDASVALAQVAAAYAAGRPLAYEVRGTLRLADGSVWPFHRRGVAPQPTGKP